MKPSNTVFPWLMLLSRFVLFAIVQALIAIYLRLSGAEHAWAGSARWWLFSVIVANLISMVLLNRLFHLEGQRFLDVFRFHRDTFWKDLALSFGALLLAGPIAMYSSNVAAGWTVGTYQAGIDLMFQPLPTWAIVIGFLFPLTIAFSELPTYFGYSMPRLEKQLGSGWLAWALASLALSLQHTTLPLILDGQFILWRALMFLPFAFYIGWVIKLRPRLLPFVAIGHFLIDLATLSAYFTL
jgi:hypothetical protein